MAHAQQAAAAQANPEVAALVARARVAQAVADGYDQERVDELVAAAGWAIIEPARNRALAELAVADTGIGNVEDKVRKNHRKTLGLLRDHGLHAVFFSSVHSRRRHGAEWEYNVFCVRENSPVLMFPSGRKKKSPR